MKIPEQFKKLFGKQLVKRSFDMKIMEFKL